jgi:hypothetical protein
MSNNRHLPIEIINYCLEYADTATKLVYNATKSKLEFHFDFSHPKYNSLLRLFLTREIQMDDNIIHVHLPWLRLTTTTYFVANIMIYDNIPKWNTQIIYVKMREKEKEYRIDSL